MNQYSQKCYRRALIRTLLFSVIINPSAILFKSIEGMLIATSMNLSMTNIANEVVVNHKTLVTKNHIAFKEIVFYRKGNTKH